MRSRATYTADEICEERELLLEQQSVLTKAADLRRLLISKRNFFRSGELIVEKQTEPSHGFWKRRIVMVIGYPAPNHYLACSFHASLITA
jgi:hypothetical protein